VSLDEIENTADYLFAGWTHTPVMCVSVNIDIEV
jgi:hypothetical protein